MGTDEGPMERVTVRMPKQMIRALEELTEMGYYNNRAAAVRDGTRHLLMEEFRYDRDLESQEDPVEAVKRYDKKHNASRTKRGDKTWGATKSQR